MDQVLQSLSICCALPPLKKLQRDNLTTSLKQILKDTFYHIKNKQRIFQLIKLCKMLTTFLTFFFHQAILLSLLVCSFGKIFPILSAIKWNKRNFQNFQAPKTVAEVPDMSTQHFLSSKAKYSADTCPNKMLKVHLLMCSFDQKLPNNCTVSFLLLH